MYLSRRSGSSPRAERLLEARLEGWQERLRLGYVALILVVVHLVALGLKGWLAPAKWSWMPPISLLAVLAAAFPVLVKMREKRNR